MFNSDYTVGCDVHKHLTLFTVLDEMGDLVQRTRIGHVSGALARNLAESAFWVLIKSEPYGEPLHWAPEGKKSSVSFSQWQVRA